MSRPSAKLNVMPSGASSMVTVPQSSSSIGDSSQDEEPSAPVANETTIVESDVNKLMRKKEQRVFRLLMGNAAFFKHAVPSTAQGTEDPLLVSAEGVNCMRV